MQADSPFNNLRIGMNIQCFVETLEAWKAKLDYGGSDSDGTLSKTHRLLISDIGLEHWPILAAENGGVLNLSISEHTDGDGRSYTTAPFPIQSIPRSSGLRAAFTSPYPGEVLVCLDWRASHWQLMAFASEDKTMIEDLSGDDFYHIAFPGVERAKAKQAASALLNGGGLNILIQILGNDTAAREFSLRYRQLFSSRWSVAKAWLDRLKASTQAEGFSGKDHQATGIGLMRLEAANLREFLTCGILEEHGAKVVLPMHDGVLLSVPEDNAAEAGECFQKLMVYFSTKSEAQADDRPDRWVSMDIGSSWSGESPQSLGHDMRARLLESIHGGRPLLEVAAAAAVHPDATAQQIEKLPPRSPYRTTLRSAIKLAAEAKAWVVRVARKKDSSIVELSNLEPNYSNMRSIVEGDRSLPKLSLDVRANTILMDGTPATDKRIRETYLPVLANKYGMLQVREPLLLSVVADVAEDKTFDPVQQYLEGLPQWDGVERASSWLVKYAGAEDTQLVRAYSKKWLISVVARAYEPGCKVDNMLVLYGKQGAGKSTALREIAPNGSFSAIALDPDNKDIVLRAARYAVVEWPELAGASRRETESLKAYFSSQEDEVRRPYGRADIRVPRRTVFAATTNTDDFLRDATGSRRFWPVQVGEVNVQGIRHDREQIWAEARHMYLAESSGRACLWWLTPEEDDLREIASVEFEVEDLYSHKLLEFIRMQGFPASFRLGEFVAYLNLTSSEAEKVSSRLRACLKRNGFVSRSVRESEGSVVRKWVCPTSGPFAAPPKRGPGARQPVAEA